MITNVYDSHIHPGATIRIVSLIALSTNEDLNVNPITIEGELLTENFRVIRSNISPIGEGPPIITGYPTQWQVRINSQFTLPSDLEASEFDKMYIFRWKFGRNGQIHHYSDEAFVVKLADTKSYRIKDHVFKDNMNISFRVNTKHSTLPQGLNLQIQPPSSISSHLLQEYTFTPESFDSQSSSFNINIPKTELYQVYTRMHQIKKVINPIWTNGINPPNHTVVPLEQAAAYLTSPTTHEQIDRTQTMKLELPMSFEPYILNWFLDGVFIQDSRLWIINREMNMCIENLKGYIESSFTRHIALPSEWDDAKYMHFLQLGLNKFNSMHRPTTFTFTKAGSSAMGALVICAAWQAASSRAVEEGERIIDQSSGGSNFSHQKDQAFESLLSRLDPEVERISQFKAHLIRVGILTGEGTEDEMMASRTPYSAQHAVFNGYHWQGRPL